MRRAVQWERRALERGLARRRAGEAAVELGSAAWDCGGGGEIGDVDAEEMRVRANARRSGGL